MQTQAKHTTTYKAIKPAQKYTNTEQKHANRQLGQLKTKQAQQYSKQTDQIIVLATILNWRTRGGQLNETKKNGNFRYS